MGFWRIRMQVKQDLNGHFVTDPVFQILPLVILDGVDGGWNSRLRDWIFAVVIESDSLAEAHEDYVNGHSNAPTVRVSR